MSQIREEKWGADPGRPFFAILRIWVFTTSELKAIKGFGAEGALDLTYIPKGSFWHLG